MRGAGLVVLTPEGVRQRSDTSRPLFELRSVVRPCLSSGMLFHPVEEPKTWYNIFAMWDVLNNLTSITQSGHICSMSLRSFDMPPSTWCLKYQAAWLCEYEIMKCLQIVKHCWTSSLAGDVFEKLLPQKWQNEDVQIIVEKWIKSEWWAIWSTHNYFRQV